MCERSNKRNAGLPTFVGWCLLAVVLVLLLSPSWVSSAPFASPSELQPAVCRIQNRLSGSNNLGSGTLIDRTNDGRQGLILTCAHLFHEGVGSVVVTFSDGRTHGAKLLAIDREADLAALVIANPQVEPARVSLTALQQGQLFACGYGPRGVYRCAVGRDVGQASTEGQLSLMISDGVRSGDSGGGVFDQQGRLVAVIWGESQGVTYASYGKPLQRFLGRVLNRKTPAAASCPSGVCPRPPLPRPRRPIAGGLESRPSGTNLLGDSLLARIEQLEKKKQDRGDYVTRVDLKEYLRRGSLSGYVRAEELERVENEGKEERESLLNRLGSLGRFGGASAGRVAGKAAVGFLGMSGPAGWGILAATTVGGWFIGSRMKRKTAGAGGRRRRPFSGSRPKRARNASADRA